MTKRSPLTFKVDKLAATPVEPTQPSIAANTETRKQSNDKTAIGRAGRQFIAAHVTPEAAKQFKLLAVQQDTTTQNLLLEAINDLFAKHGLSRIA